MAKEISRAAFEHASVAVIEISTALRSHRPVRVPLSKLVLSPDNVRKGEPTLSGLAELAASITAHGLLNPLHVSEFSPESGTYSVEAGGRRLRALKLLAGNGKISADEPIDCRLIEADTVEVSLSENLGIEAMHPADEFLAFRRLIDDGATPEMVAQRFGVTALHVQRRMKLACVAFPLLELFREGKMSLEQITALASVDDQSRQLAVWNGLPSYNRSAYCIKAKLTEAEVPSNDERVTFVGLDRYIAAGGEVRHDLFSENGIQYLSDPGLLDMLVSDLLTQASEELKAEGYGWAEPMLSYGYNERSQFREMPKKYLPETPEQVAERESLESKLEAVDSQIEALYDQDDQDDEGEGDQDSSANASDKIDALNAQSESLQKKLQALQQARLDTSGYDKSLCGVVVTIDDGVLRIHRGLVKASDGKALATKLAAQGDSEGARALAGLQSGKERPEVPEKLLMNLTSQRTAAMQASLIGQPSVALALLAARLATQVFSHRYVDSSVKIGLTESRHALDRNSPSFASSRAAEVLAAKRERLESVLPEDPASWFAFFLAQPQELVLSVIVFATAASLDTVQCRSGSNEQVTEIHKALALDMADWWQPTAENYVSLVPKAKMIEAVTEAKGASVAADIAKLKKDEAIKHTVALLSGTRWLPAALRSVTDVDSQSNA